MVMGKLGRAETVLVKKVGERESGQQIVIRSANRRVCRFRIVLNPSSSRRGLLLSDDLSFANSCIPARVRLRKVQPQTPPDASPQARSVVQTRACSPASLYSAIPLRSVIPTRTQR